MYLTKPGSFFEKKYFVISRISYLFKYEVKLKIVIENY